MANSPSIEQALSHTTFVRGLARALLRSDAHAEDIEQETWLVAAQKGPDDPSRMKHWLGGVLRRRAAATIRHRQVERKHAQNVATDISVPSTAEVVAREETRREVVAALLELKTPYRDALLLRYYEDLPPRRIAERLGVPVETARTRVKRGLVQLRSKLDDRHGDRSAWTPLVASLASVLPTASSAGKSVGMTICAIVLLGAVAGGLWWGLRDSPAPQVGKTVLVGAGRDDGPTLRLVKKQTGTGEGGMEPGTASNGDGNTASPVTNMSPEQPSGLSLEGDVVGIPRKHQSSHMMGRVIAYSMDQGDVPSVRGYLNPRTMRYVVKGLRRGRWRVTIEVHGRHGGVEADTGSDDADVHFNWIPIANTWAPNSNNASPASDQAKNNVAHIRVMTPAGIPVPHGKYEEWAGVFAHGGGLKSSAFRLSWYRNAYRGVVDVFGAKDAGGRRLPLGALVLSGSDVSTGEQVVTLPNELTIGGKVRIGGSTPPQGTKISAHVEVTGSRGKRISPHAHDTALTATDGSFELRGLGPYQYSLRITGPDIVPGAHKESVDAGATDVTVDIPAALTIVLNVVRDEDDSPVAGAGVWVEAANSETYFQGSEFGRESDLKTDENGKMVVRRVNPTVPQMIRIDPPRHESHETSTRLFRWIRNPWEPTDQTIRMKKAHPCRGVVTSLEGVPLGHVELKVKGRRNVWHKIVKSDENGRFAIEGVGAEGIHVKAVLGWQESALVLLKAGAEHAKITFDSGVSFAAMLDSTKLEAPTQGYIFYSCRNRHGEYVRPRQGLPTLSSNQRKDFVGVEADATWSIYWRSESNQTVGWLRDVRPRHGDVLRVPLFPAGTIEGRLDVPEGLASRSLRVVVAIDGIRREIPINADGTFTATSLPPTTIHLSCWNSSLRGNNEGPIVEARPGDSVVLEVRTK